ncbi:MAG: sigma-54-dependent Fis family transcriptional regulator [Acidobacteria bacterium]|nr:sigma-54-dependent Fis family transcriptional regulator [Acidobacteriota bacterium]MBI3423727.1 sigma-54-dependent Fis family transcriptional regulator [Acidobacteriota bacterium]
MALNQVRLLIAEDDPDLRDLLQDDLEDAGYETVLAVDGRAALAQVEREREFFDLLITDVNMPGLTGTELLAAMRQQRAEAPVVIITAFGSVEQAVEMVKAGAFQYLTKPFETVELLRVVDEALQQSATQRAQARLRRELPGAPPKIIGASRPMQELFKLMARAARGTSTVLITGESGTGKELVARSMHDMSGRRGQFVPVNCAAIPADLIESELFGHTGQAFTGAKQVRAGLFESAEGGSLLLDEIGELPLLMQPKLLRVLQEGRLRRVGSDQEKEFNVRIIAATNRDLEKEVQAGRFREDLFWRLNVIHLHIPPLRERPFDIPLLVEHFLNKLAKSAQTEPLNVTAEALAVLTAYAWPGNARELENAIERAVALAEGTNLAPHDLPERIRNSGQAAQMLTQARQQRMTLRELEREYILETLRLTDGNKSRAAELLGFDRRTLHRKLDEYRVEDPNFAL